MNIVDIKKYAEDALLSKKNVNSVGIGYKVKDGVTTDEVVIVVGVNKKSSDVSEADLIPKQIEGINTDVIEIGEIVGHGGLPGDDLRNPVDFNLPARPGDSACVVGAVGGTIGAVVRDKATGKRLLLSNNHVFANYNNAVVGDVIHKPSTVYGGNAGKTEIGRLTRFIPMVYDGNTPNKADCAVAEVTGTVLDNHVMIGVATGVKAPVLGMKVQKYGAKSKYRTGKVYIMNYTSNVLFRDKYAKMENQIMFLGDDGIPMSEPGDSGAAYLDMENNLVALNHAGSGSFGFGASMPVVFDLLGVEMPKVNEPVPTPVPEPTPTLTPIPPPPIPTPTPEPTPPPLPAKRYETRLLIMNIKRKTPVNIDETKNAGFVIDNSGNVFATQKFLDDNARFFKVIK